MSQTRKIYQFLAHAHQPSADQALLLAFRRAEPPYQTALLKTIVNRGSGSANNNLIASFHQYPLRWQDIFTNKIDSLHSGLRKATNNNLPQTRLNVLQIISRTKCYCLADLVVALLRDTDQAVRRSASAALLHLTKNLATLRQELPLPQATAPDPTDEKTTTSAKILTDSLALALANCRQLPNEDVVLAAMYLVPADLQQFWPDQFAPHTFVGRTVRHLLTTRQQPRLARFCISALSVPALRPAAARAVTNAHRTEFIAALATAYAPARESLASTDALKLIRQPNWLDAQLLPSQQFEQHCHHDLITFVADLAAPPEQIADYLSALALTAAETDALHAIDTLAQLPRHAANEPLARATSAPIETVALTAANHLSALPAPQLYRAMVPLLACPHESVRRLACRALQGFAFETYWNNFENLPTQHRITAGQAVFKIDPAAQSQWADKANDQFAKHRLRALSIARLLDRADQCATVLMQLATDPDCLVRSCAVGSLAQVTTPDLAPQVQAVLLTALDDPDCRVQANAVEALEKRNAQHLTKHVARFNEHPNPRLRANSIKAQLSFKAHAAQQTIAKMLADARPAHRLSANWVTRQIQHHSPNALLASYQTETPYATVSIFTN